MNAKNQVEYSEIYESLQKDWQAYQSAKNIINRIKIHANNGDFQTVASELGNFVSKNFTSNLYKPNVFNTNDIDYKIKELTNTYISQYNKIPRIFKNISDIQAKQFAKTINDIANYYNQDARQFMNLSLDLPDNTYSNSEYSMIQPIFNEKLNEYLHRIGTNLKVTKNMKGIVFDKSSPISQKLSNFEQLQKDIRVKYNKNIKFISGLDISTDTNLQYSVGHFTILNPRIENGVFKGELFDIYDFNWENLNEEFKDLYKYIINNGAYTLQEMQLLENYYFLIPIEFIW